MHKAILLFPVLYLTATDSDRLEIATEPAVASVAPVEDGRRLIRLPLLEFPMRIAAHCGNGGEMRSVSVSVADTRRNFTPDDYAEEEQLETIVKVSPKQLAPIAVQSFCIAGEPPSAPLLLERALIAQVSLRCARQEDSSVIFESKALDVRLECREAETPASE